MQFLYPALTAGFFLALAPLLIHLINMMRHRRVPWAAMEFLLQSYKKHRKWVWLKQLILLLMRMAAMALIVAMLAQLVTHRRYEGLFGSTLTHHYVVVDDSMSMTDRAGGTTAFERAMSFVRQLGGEAAKQEFHQRFTLIRFSQAKRAEEIDPDAETVPQIADLNAEDVDTDFALRLEEIRRSTDATQLPVGPEAALQVVRRLMKQNGNENRILYLVSDFRTNQWDNPSEIRQLLSDIEKEEARVHLINCVRAPRTNLAITGLKPSDETRASGVPLFMNIDITNFGDQAVDNVQLKVRTVFYASAIAKRGAAERPAGEIDDAPIIEIERIAPQQTVTQRVQVYFPEAGQHVVEAILPEDTISADNRRWCVVEFPEHESVLVIDGDPNQRNAFYVQAIFEPGQRARTGIRPDARTTAFLRDTTAEALRGYSAIYLFDVDRLDDRALENLETYVKDGGGLAIFVGPQINKEFYNRQLYRDGKGLFPLPLDRDDLLDTDPLDEAPDVEVMVAGHPVFHELTQGQNPIVRTIHVERFFRPVPEWMPDSKSTVRVLAQLRNRMPLAVEKSFGKGRVIALTTTYAPYWNDIALGPSVIVALRLQSYLGFSRRASATHVVAQRIDQPFDGETYRQDLKIFVPGDDPALPEVIERTASKRATDARWLDVSLRGDETDRSGIYEIWANRIDGEIDALRYAVNVDPREGNLAQTSTRDIVTQLDPIPVQIGYADQYESAAIEQSGFNQSLLLMCLLVLLLVGEQILAYYSSSHPARGTSATEGSMSSPAKVARMRNENDSPALGAAGARLDWNDLSEGSDVPLGQPQPTNTVRGAQR